MPPFNLCGGLTAMASQIHGEGLAVAPPIPGPRQHGGKCRAGGEHKQTRNAAQVARGEQANVMMTAHACAPRRKRADQRLKTDGLLGA